MPATRQPSNKQRSRLMKAHCQIDCIACQFTAIAGKNWLNRCFALPALSPDLPGKDLLNSEKKYYTISKIILCYFELILDIRLVY